VIGVRFPAIGQVTFWDPSAKRALAATKLQVIGFDDLAHMLSLGHNKQVALLPSLITAGLIVFRAGRFGR
jgi:hypothetical protein